MSSKVAWERKWPIWEKVSKCPFDLISVFWNSPEKHEHNFISHIKKSFREISNESDEIFVQSSAALSVSFLTSYFNMLAGVASG